MLIKAVMMCKNEDELLPIWAGYHGHLLGFENLYVFDNGSTTAASIRALDELEARGAHVDRTFGRAEDYPAKGQILAGLIHRLDQEAPADFYFPLDCDEFLAVEQGWFAVDCSREALEQELAPHVGFQGALEIATAYDNRPGAPKTYVRSGGQLKVFSAQGACIDLDHGSHVGAFRSEERRKTRVTYVHHHFKPFATLLEHAREKLTPFVEDLSLEALAEHRRNNVPGSHLFRFLELPDEASYLDSFNPGFFEPLTGFTSTLDGLGLRTPYADRHSQD